MLIFTLNASVEIKAIIEENLQHISLSKFQKSLPSKIILIFLNDFEEETMYVHI